MGEAFRVLFMTETELGKVSQAWMCVLCVKLNMCMYGGLKQLRDCRELCVRLQTKHIIAAS